VTARGRPTYDDELILLEMARESLTGRHPSDWDLAKAFAPRVEAASLVAAHRRLYSKFRRRKGDLLARIPTTGED
jgi:hypothetical protein